MSKSERIQIAETIKSQIHSMILDCAGAHNFTECYNKDYRGGLGFKIQNTSKYDNATVMIYLTWADDYTIVLLDMDADTGGIADNTYKIERVYAPELGNTLETMWETKETKKTWDKHKRYEMKIITQ